MIFMNSYIDQNATKTWMHRKHFLISFSFSHYELDRNITAEELSEAIQNMNSGKAPGPDGLPKKFYKNKKLNYLSHF